LPKKYTSSTLVLVEQPTVPTDVIKPVVDGQPGPADGFDEGGKILSRSRLGSDHQQIQLIPAAAPRCAHGRPGLRG